MKTSQRREVIKNQLMSMGELQFDALANRFGVSEMTIRRDAEFLEGEGFARRVRGGLISIKSRAFESVFENRSVTAFTAKRAIAELTVKLLVEDEVVILDSGSTVLEVARQIRSTELRLTAITHSLRAALEVIHVPDSRVIVTGGALKSGELSLVGLEAEESFANLNCDTFIAGVAGLDALRGVSEFDMDEVRVKRAAIRCARRIVAVADKSKLGQVHLVSLLPLNELDVLVTDASPDHPVVRACVDAGVEVAHVIDPGEQAVVVVDA